MMTSPLVLSCRASFSPAYNTTCDLNILWGWGGGEGGEEQGRGGGRSCEKFVKGRVVSSFGGEGNVS